jgi:hypothetical protein
MGDEADRLSNLCADLVSLRRLEPGLACLFQRGRGDWVRVRELYLGTEAPTEEIGPGLFAAWLRCPSGDPDYAVICFFDVDSGWSGQARYNVGRLTRATVESQSA